MTQRMIAPLLLLFPLAVLACPPKEVEAIQRARYVAAATIDTVTTAPSGDDTSCLVYAATVSSAFYGECSTNSQVRFAVRHRESADPFEKGTRCLVYLRRVPASDPPWETASGGRGIQRDTPELRKLVKSMVSGRKSVDQLLSRKESSTDLLPLERKMNSIIIPEIDLCCANVHDVIDLFNVMSKEFDKSTPADSPRGVTIRLRLTDSDRPCLVRYYAENASLLKHLRILESLGYSYAITSDQVEVRMKPMPGDGQQEN